MDRMKIAAIFADQEQLGGKEITVCGWARTIRDMKTFGFIELNDGSCFRNLQVVMSADELHNYKEIAGQNVGAALIVRGTGPICFPPPSGFAARRPMPCMSFSRAGALCMSTPPSSPAPTARAQARCSR